MLLLIPFSFAFDSEDQDVVIRDEVELFENSEYSTGILPPGSPLGVEFAIEANGGASLGMQGVAELSWPDALTLLFTGAPGTGVLLLDGSLDAVTYIAIDLSDYGYEGNFEIDRRSLTFDGSGFFDPFVLDGAATPRVEVADTTDSLQLIDYNLDILPGLGVSFSAAMEPTITVGYESIYWSANETIINTESTPGMLPAEAVPNYPVNTTLRGAWDARFDLIFTPAIEACASIFGCIEVLQFDIPVNMLTDVMEEDLSAGILDFPLPLLVPGVESADFGDVYIQTIANLEVSLGDDGELPVYGDVRVDGGTDFSVFPDQFNANPGTTDGVVVTFIPSVLGPQTANLVLTSNDPSRPDLIIPISANGYEDEPTDYAGVIDEDNVKKGEVKACGCDSGTAPAGIGLFGLAGLALLRRRPARSASR